MADKLALKQVKSAAGASQKQIDSLRTLGLGRIGKSSERADVPTIRGVLRKVEHLVEVDDG